MGLGKNGIPEYRNTGGPDTGKSAIHNPQSAIKKTGFTLMELMMSLGILVVGLAMVATAFPSAMLETKLSVADTSATMISENAAAICRVRLSHTTINGFVDGQLRDLSTLCPPPPALPWLPDAERAYPIARGDQTTNLEDWIEVLVPPAGPGTYWIPSSRYGWLVAARQPADGVNDYQLVIVPYRKFLPTDRLGTEFEFVPVTVTDSGTRAAGADIGSPVILTTGASVGAFAFVVDADGTLSPTLADGAALAVNYSGGDNSPAIGCYVVRTSVRP